MPSVMSDLMAFRAADRMTSGIELTGRIPLLTEDREQALGSLDEGLHRHSALGGDVGVGLGERVENCSVGGHLVSGLRVDSAYKLCHVLACGFSGHATASPSASDGQLPSVIVDIPVVQTDNLLVRSPQRALLSRVGLGRCFVHLASMAGELSNRLVATTGFAPPRCLLPKQPASAPVKNSPLPPISEIFDMFCIASNRLISLDPSLSIYCYFMISSRVIDPI